MAGALRSSCNLLTHPFLFLPLFTRRAAPDVPIKHIEINCYQNIAMSSLTAAVWTGQRGAARAAAFSSLSSTLCRPSFQAPRFPTESGVQTRAVSSSHSNAFGTAVKSTGPSRGTSPVRVPLSQTGGKGATTTASSSSGFHLSSQPALAPASAASAETSSSTATAATATGTPDYLAVNYWWAYVHPNAVAFWERPILVNAILWGNYNRLRDWAIAQLSAKSADRTAIEGRILQIACAYGSVTPYLVGRLSTSARLDVIDILPVQLENLRSKIGDDRRVEMHQMDSSSLEFSSETFDQALLFFLLHEQPRQVRECTLSEAVRCLKPGGTLLIVDYSKLFWWNPYRYFWKPILKFLEPFAGDLLDNGIGKWLPTEGIVVEEQKTFFGGLFEVMRIRKE